MNIKFTNKKMMDRLTNSSRLKKEYGRLAKPIGQLIDAIKGLKIQELHSLSGFHELKEQAKGIYAVTIKHPFRLILSINNPDQVLILDVVDYHGKNRIINHYNNKKYNYYDN